MNVFFEKAVPVWVTGREKEMNLRVQFKAVFGKGKSITAKIAIKKNASSVHTFVRVTFGVTFDFYFQKRHHSESPFFQ